MSTSALSPTLRLRGRWKSTVSGLNTSRVTGAENRSPALVTVRAHADHLPACAGALIDSSVDELAELKTKPKQNPVSFDSATTLTNS